MLQPDADSVRKSPPAFPDAASLRQRACAAGLDPAYWYAVEYDRAVRPGQVVEVRFWHTSIALYRAEDGRLGAVENRCAHRQLKLSQGRVEGCRLACRYHGWSYDPDGRLAQIPHELFGKPFPSVRLRSYPVQVRYGLIWLFFGDPTLAQERPLPRIQELEGEAPWACTPIDFLWRAHATMIVNNAVDSTHVPSLHRRFQTRTLEYGPVTRCESQGDRVLVRHAVKMSGQGLLRLLTSGLRNDIQDVCYEYPYVWVSVGGVFKLWNFILPVDEHTSRVFMLSCAETLKIPFTSWRVPRPLVTLATRLAKPLLVRPLFDEDGWSAQAEQEGYEDHFATPAVDLHPAIRMCYQLTIRKWEEHLSRASPRPA